MAEQEQGDLDKRKRVVATTIASPLAGVIAKYACHPIDTIKSKVQARATDLHSVREYKVGHSLDLVKNTWKNQGICGFFPGVTLSAFGSIIAFSAYMTAYERSKNELEKHYKVFEKHPALNHLFSGFIAEIASCIFWLPIDIVKERLQVQSEVKIFKYAGPRDAIKKINATQGLIGLYRAFGATLILFGPTSALFFVFYQEFKKRLIPDGTSPTLGQSIVCSAGASSIAGFMTTPLQMVKLRMQIQRADKATTGEGFQKTIYGYRNIFHGLFKVTQSQGWLALYKGAGLRILFTVPIFAISMSCTQIFREAVLQSSILETMI